jgi:proteasome assembly chaperone (PAC2) family protein
MDELIELYERPQAQEIFMIAGWRQWADAGSVSSELPTYLVEHTHAVKIGGIRPDGFYLFQIPGTHDLLRPQIKLSDGHPEWIEARRNEFFYTGDARTGLAIFSGDEPHRDVERYTDAFFDVVEALGVRKVAVVAGVYAATPYDRDRHISCVYSLPAMKAHLFRYAVQFSNYEGGASIGTCLAHRAEQRGIEFLALYALVPFYDFGRLAAQFTGIQIERDLKAWYDLMLRLNHMFGLGLDLSDLHEQAESLVTWVDDQIDELDKKAPYLQVREYLDNLARDFEETPFAPLSDLWERELRDLFED